MSTFDSHYDGDGKPTAMALCPSLPSQIVHAGPHQDAFQASDFIDRDSHSTINENFVEHSCHLILERWACKEPGHSVCFTSSLVHVRLSRADIEHWARAHTSGEASTSLPPDSLLARGISAPQLGFQLDSSESIYSSSLSSLSYLSSIVPFIGYTGGSAVKGVGNIIIGTIGYLDRKFREQQLRAVLKHSSLLEHPEHKRKWELPLVRPRVSSPKQLNDLLNNIWEFGVSGVVHTKDLCRLANRLDAHNIPTSNYLCLKWLRITQIFLLDQSSNSLLSSVDEQLFLSDIDVDAQVVSSVSHLLMELYTFHEVDGFASFRLESKNMIHLLLAQTLDRQEPASDKGHPKWNDLLRACNFLPGSRQTPNTPLVQFGDLLWTLHKLHFWPESMAIDAHPAYKFSVWRNTCDELAAWLKEHGTAARWAVNSPLEWMVDSILTMMTNTSSAARRQALRTADFLVPLIEAVPDELWDAVAADCLGMDPRSPHYVDHWQSRCDFPETLTSAHDYKLLALRLARDF